jgi:hypothetical protein
MTINTDPNSDYTMMSTEVEKVRDAVLGSFFVKRKPLYLPHPSSVDTTSPEQVERYRQYTCGAEFPEYTKSTLTSMLDKMSADDSNVELPDKISYLIEDSDGDGLSLKGLMESCASNVLQVKWHVLLADYKGLSDVDIDSVSIADKERLNPRATINQYSRENVIDWAFGRINGRMQLIYMLLRETGETIDTATGEKTEVESFLKLAINEGGYTQQKITADEGGNEEGEIYPVIVSGQQLKFIPVEIVSDSEIQPGKMPLDTGFLTAISDLAYYCYRVSADHKECLSNPPLIIASGIEDMDGFEEDNGRRYFATGPHCVNVVRNENAKVTMTQSQQSQEQYDRYYDRSERKVRANGGSYKTEASVQQTAAEFMKNAEAQVAILGPMVNSIEPSIKTMCLYCGMFEGIYSVENLQSNIDDIEIKMPREFAVSKLTFNEVKTYIELFNNGQMSQAEMLKVLDLGGWLVSDAEALGLEIENSGQSLTGE